MYWVGAPYQAGSYREKFTIITDNTTAIFTSGGISAGKLTLNEFFEQEFKNGTKSSEVETLRVINNVSFNPEKDFSIAFTNLSYGDISQVYYDSVFSFFDQRQHQNLILFGFFFGVFILTTVIICRKGKRKEGF